MLTVTAVTNSGRSEVKAEDKVLANTGLEHTGYNSYAGVAATLFDYEKSLTAENAVTVEKENVEMVATAQDAQQEAQPQLTQEQQEWQTKLMPNVEESLNVRAQAMNSQILLENYIKEVWQTSKKTMAHGLTSSQEM